MSSTALAWGTLPVQWASASASGTPSTHELLRRAGGATGRELVANVVAFSRVLRTKVTNVTAGRIIDGCRSLQYLDLSDERDFHTALRSNLITSQDDIPAFEALYQLYWRPQSEQSPLQWLNNRPTSDEGIPIDLDLPGGTNERLLFQDVQGNDEGPDDGAGGDSDMVAYSAGETLTHKDFQDFTPDEIRAIQHLMARLTPKLATAMSRRTKASYSGRQLDLRRSIRHNLRYGGDMVTLARRRRKVRKLKVAMVCDVSGSMDRYSRFLLQFLYGLENDMTGVDAWVFSTRLTEVSHLLRGRGYEESLARIAESVHDWSGGTTIGNCLYEFANGPGRTRLTRRTVVVIISDGWDRGDVTLLEQAMRRLRQNSYKIVWLNPLLASPGYEPLCAGMKTALPYVDYFMSAHNLESLVKLTKTLNALGRAL